MTRIALIRRRYEKTDIGNFAGGGLVDDRGDVCCLR